jgi:hypothetical protein
MSANKIDLAFGTIASYDFTTGLSQAYGANAMKDLGGGAYGMFAGDASGDGGVDVEPIAHLYKTQVYQLAEYLGIPEEIRRRPPTTDTYSAHQSQQEFFFRLPFETMDLLWYAQEQNIPFQPKPVGHFSIPLSPHPCPPRLTTAVGDIFFYPGEGGN